MQERYALAAPPKRGSKDRQHEHGGLPDSVELTTGVEVMVISNVSTDLVMTNGA